jgi:hypothetical protein
VPQIPPKKKADRGKSGKKWDYIGFIWGYIRIMGYGVILGLYGVY